VAPAAPIVAPAAPDEVLKSAAKRDASTLNDETSSVGGFWRETMDDSKLLCTLCGSSGKFSSLSHRLDHENSVEHRRRLRDLETMQDRRNAGPPKKAKTVADDSDASDSSKDDEKDWNPTSPIDRKQLVDDSCWKIIIDDVANTVQRHCRVCKKTGVFPTASKRHDHVVSGEHQANLAKLMANN
jgi:hypothetical protein